LVFRSGFFRRLLPRLASPVVVAGFVALSGEASAHEVGVVDGRLQHVLHRTTQRKIARSTESEFTIGCFLRVREPAAVAERIVELGGKVGVTAGDLLSARLPVAAIRVLAADPRVMRIEAGSPVRPKLDKVREVIDLAPVHSGEAPLTRAHRGAGVVVGVVDLSLDLFHPAFRSGGRSRVAAVWDQAGDRSPPEGFEYGRSCAREAIAADNCPLAVESEHGTHVTGIAAGSQVRGSPYTGVAPAADIVFVHLADPVDESMTFDEWLSVSVCDGVKFVFDVAQRLGEPAVVNLSLGTHTGPHDGSSLASACLDALAGPGRIIVAAAGNEGEPWIHPRLDELVYVHASGEADAVGRRVDFVVGEYVGFGEIVDVWLDAGGEAASLRVGVRGAADDAILTAPVSVGDAPFSSDLVVAGQSLGPIFVTSDRTPGGSINFQLTVVDADGDLAETEHDWFFVLSDAGRFDAFLDVNGGGGFVQSNPDVVVDSRMSIGYPAVARNVIAVGSTVSRTDWVAANGDEYEIFDYLTGDPLMLGQLSTFSSRGPTRNPALTGPKPDFVAPGEMIASAMPNARGLDVRAATIVSPAPGGYFVGGGTSQAAPVVAGLVALMLERDPDLDPSSVRELLRGSAEAPRGVETPSEDWGFGLVNALGAVIATPDVAPPTEPPPEVAAEGGCGCHVPSAEGAPGRRGWPLLLGLGLVAWGRRRRARADRSAVVKGAKSH
jgi:minor extracellular serine protease Vpr